MPAIKINAVEHAAFMQARTLSGDPQKALRKSIWAAIRQRFGIPTDIKLSVELDDAGSADYLVVKDKASGHWLYWAQDGDNGVERYSHSEAAPGAQVQAAAVAPAPATVRYATISAAEIVYSAQAEREDFDIVRRPDCGRIAYDEEHDLILVRIPQD